MREPAGTAARHEQRRNRRHDRAAADADDLGHRRLDHRDARGGYPAVRALHRSSARRLACTPSGSPPSTTTTRTAARPCMAGWLRWLKGASSAAPVPERSFTPDALPALLVFHGRPLPDRAITAGDLTASWIDRAKRQLAQTPLSVRAAAIRHALGFAHETASRAPAATSVAPPCRAGRGDDAGGRSGAAESWPHRSRHHVHAIRPGRRRQGPALRNLQPDRRQPARGGDRRGASRGAGRRSSSRQAMPRLPARWRRPSRCRASPFSTSTASTRASTTPS